MVNGITNNDICQLFNDILAMIHHAVVSPDTTDAMYINERYLNSQTKTLSNKRSIDMILSYHFRS